MKQRIAQPLPRHILVWRRLGTTRSPLREDIPEQAVLLNPDGTEGVRFQLSHRPTCYRRGPYRLLIEVLGTPWHHDWGCFDEQDQPERNYHHKSTAQLEAAAIAKVLVADFDKVQQHKETLNATGSNI